jgi:hypothetical protein
VLVVNALIEFMEFEQLPTPNPKDHAKNLEEILASLKILCRSEIHVFRDPKGKALLETTAEVLGGLEKAFHNFANKEVDVWKEEQDEYFQKSSDPWD